MNWIQTPPHNTLKLQSFVELCNYWRSHQLLREAQSWCWQSSSFMVLHGSPLALLRRWFQFCLCLSQKVSKGAIRMDAKDSLLGLINWYHFGCCKDKLIAALLPATAMSTGHAAGHCLPRVPYVGTKSMRNGKFGQKKVWPRGTGLCCPPKNSTGIYTGKNHI